MPVALRRFVRALLCLAAFGLAGAGLTWACTPAASVAVDPARGFAGEQATVQVRWFLDRRVEVRWDSVSGPLLASASGPDFSVSVAVPRVAPGTYTILAVSRSEGAAHVARASFTVTGTNPAGRGGPPEDQYAASEPRRGKCSRLRGRRRAACIRRNCGRLRGAKKRACVRRVTRRR